MPKNPATGNKFRFEMLHGGGRAAYGDTYRGLCEALVGYDTDRIRKELIAGGETRHGFDVAVPEELESAVTVEAATKRILFALGRSVWLQAIVNAEHWDEIEGMDGESRRALSGSRYPQPAISEWSPDVPLVLSQHDYAPYGPMPKPQGENIWWINPFTERSLIRSLHRIGDIEVFQRSDMAEPEGVPEVTLRPVDALPAAGPLLLAPGYAAKQLVDSMLGEGASPTAVMVALDAADHDAVLLSAEATGRDDAQHLIRWLQAGDVTFEQFLTALGNAGISATVTGSNRHGPPTKTNRTRRRQRRGEAGRQLPSKACPA